MESSQRSPGYIAGFLTTMRSGKEGREEVSIREERKEDHTSLQSDAGASCLHRLPPPPMSRVVGLCKIKGLVSTRNGRVVAHLLCDEIMTKSIARQWPRRLSHEILKERWLRD